MSPSQVETRVLTLSYSSRCRVSLLEKFQSLPTIPGIGVCGQRMGSPGEPRSLGNVVRAGGWGWEHTEVLPWEPRGTGKYSTQDAHRETGR